jgi:ribonucleoside-triphosphate reductase
MFKVRKREGKIVSFEIKKITEAITKAFEAENKVYDENIIDFLALKVTAHFQEKISSGLISVEDIQDSVETVLIQAGYDDVAKAYILYRR